MTDGATRPTDPNRVVLRRPLVARLFGTMPQIVLTLVAVVSVITIVAVVSSGDWSPWPFLLVQAAPVSLWARGVTAWARVDEDGIHWRYWARWDHPWSKITRVSLTRRARLATVRGNGGPPIILVSTAGHEDLISPALACGRHRREFATAVITAARAHGRPVSVLSRRWNEEPTATAQPWE